MKEWREGEVRQNFVEFSSFCPTFSSFSQFVLTSILPPQGAPSVTHHTTPPPNFSSTTLSNRFKFPLSKTTSSLLLNLLGSPLVVEVSSSSRGNEVGRCTRESSLRTNSSEEVIDSIEGGEEFGCEFGIIAMRCWGRQRGVCRLNVSVEISEKRGFKVRGASRAREGSVSELRVRGLRFDLTTYLDNFESVPIRRL